MDRMDRNVDLTGFLCPTVIVDYDNPDVLMLAARLASGSSTYETAKACFEHVRDEIQHSVDFRRNPITCRASDVLREGTGYCYAKSHLLAALLRANGIPAGFCYQRLSRDDNGRPPYVLHGLNAVFLPEFGWYRIDARGNKIGVNAQFSPPVECLAFTPQFAGESDFPEIRAEPLSCVIDALKSCGTWDDLFEQLPDSECPPRGC